MNKKYSKTVEEYIPGIRHKLALAAFFIGVMLLIVNIGGSFVNLRNPAIYNEDIPRLFDIELSEQQLYEVIEDFDGDRTRYFSKLTSSVNAGIAHYWEDDGIDKYNLRVPFYENYLLYLASFIAPGLYLKYEFADYKKAIERGVGLCSQQSIITADILNEKGIKSNIIGLSGHVVLQAQVNEEKDEWWVLDPHYGVVIPHDISYIEKYPGIIKEYYSDAGYDNATIFGLLAVIYGKEGNVVYEGEGATPYQFKKMLVEKLSYVFIWLIPFFLMLPMTVSIYRKNRD